MEKTAPAEPYRPGRAVLQGLLDLRPSPGLEVAAFPVEDAVAQGLAVAQVYAFASVDYPGAAGSLVFDSDGTTAVGAFDFDPSIDRTTAFTFAGGVYQILTVPGSTLSVATGINGAGLIVGLYVDLAGVLRGFANNGGTFSNVDFPGASGTQVIGVNDAGQMVGDYFDAADVEHGFVSSGGTFTAIDFPGATRTVAAGINAAGDIVGGWSDATGTHGFLLQAGVFTPINFPLATSTTAVRHQRHRGDRRLLQRRRRHGARLHLRRRCLQHRRRCRRPRHPPDAHQEWGSGYGRLHRRAE